MRPQGDLTQMTDMTRRTAMAAAVVGGATVATASRTATAQEPELTPDQRYVIEAGMTEAEADAWKKTAEAAAAFFALPELHPLDNQEVATAIHVIQNKLLGRPTYRKYLELAKAGHEREKRKREGVPKQ